MANQLAKGEKPFGFFLPDQTSKGFARPGLGKIIFEELKDIFRSGGLKSTIFKIGTLSILLPMARDFLINAVKDQLKLSDQTISIIKSITPLAGIGWIISSFGRATGEDKSRDIAVQGVKLGAGLILLSTWAWNMLKANLPQLGEFAKNDLFEPQVIMQSGLKSQGGFPAQGKISDAEINRIIAQMESERRPDYALAVNASSQQKGFESLKPSVVVSENKNPFVAKKAVMAA